MEQAELQELEAKLAVVDASGAIYQTIAGLVSKVGELEAEIAMLADGFMQFADILRGLAALDAQHRAQMKALQDGLTKRQKPAPEKPDPPAGGGPVN